MGRATFLSIVLACFFLQFQPITGQTRTVVYTSSSEIFQNPERGIYQLEQTGMTPGQITPYRKLDVNRLRTIRQSHSLVFRYFGLKQWRTVDLPDSILQYINSDFMAVRTAGLKIIPRFCYSAEMNEPDASLAVILRHLDQLRPILQSHKDVIAFLQAGFIGAWGEWHSSTNGNESIQNMRTILNKILTVMPAERMVQVRYPRHKQAIFSLPFDSTAAVTPAQAFTEASVARVGHHNDCFLASADDYGTYWRDNRLDTALAKPYLRLDNRFVPMGGETCAQSAFSNCTNALREMARLRWSYLNGGYNQNVINGFITGGCYDEMKRRLGYRLSLINATFTAAGQRTGKFTFSAKLTNGGWASLYNPRPFELCLRNTTTGTVYSARLPVDPRFWGAGDTVQLNFTVGIPAAMSAGHYTVLINMPDPMNSLRNRADYSVRFANVGTWESETGYNNLLDSVVIAATTSGDPYTGTLWFATAGTTQIDTETPVEFSLEQNYPNPFNASTTLQFSLPATSLVELSVFDMLGRKVTTLVNEVMAPSSYRIHFDASQLATGVYVARLIANSIEGNGRSLLISSRKMTLLK